MGICINGFDTVWGISKSGNDVKGIMKNGKRIYPILSQDNNISTTNLGSHDDTANLWLDIVLNIPDIYILSLDNQATLALYKTDSQLNNATDSTLGKIASFNYFSTVGQVEFDYNGYLIISSGSHLIKFDINTKQTVWDKEVETGDFNSNKMVIDSNNNIIIVGSGSTTIFAYCYDTNGNLLNQIGVSGAIGETVVLDNANNIYIGLSLSNNGTIINGILSYKYELASKGSYGIGFSAMPTSMIFTHNNGYVGLDDGSIYKFYDKTQGALSTAVQIKGIETNLKTYDLFKDSGGFVYAILADPTGSSTELIKYDWDGSLISTSSITNCALIRGKWARTRDIYCLPVFSYSSNTQSISVITQK